MFMSATRAIMAGTSSMGTSKDIMFTVKAREPLFCSVLCGTKAARHSDPFTLTRHPAQDTGITGQEWGPTRRGLRLRRIRHAALSKDTLHPSFTPCQLTKDEEKKKGKEYEVWKRSCKPCQTGKEEE